MIIKGSQINPLALEGVKSLADLKKLEIFKHLPDEDEANKELWEAIRPEPELPAKGKPKQTEEPE